MFKHFHPQFVVCSYCERTRRVNRNGLVRKHTCPASGKTCHGSYKHHSGMCPSPFSLDSKTVNP